ncbi:Tetratricopeptide repeat protein [Candidatus Koribacter versatilis Ellin345]|uniref:Tetratricopeptide repeat protein n=1 Tax=Koribacter versatilis (strain Ellin345) TaxID=204669 RepID=Q1IK32_KORVE|nr:Tetratricopeptide repeat protein [Candidatus Koribacter versatilis Ellin345]
MATWGFLREHALSPLVSRQRRWHVNRRIMIQLCAFLLGLPLLAQTPTPTPPPPQQTPLEDPGLQRPAPPVTLLPLDTSTAAELEAQGDQLRGHNLYLDAVDSYKAAIRKEPTPSLYNKLGIALIQLRHPEESIETLNHAIKMQKDFSDAWNNRGGAYYMEGNFKKASKDFEHAIKINADNASYHSNLGSAYFNRHDYIKASKEYTIALKLDPYVFERSSKMGITASMGKPSDRAEFEYMMAKLFAQTGDAVDCLLHLRKAMEEGYKNINNVYKDQEFAAVRADQRFKDLMAQKPEAIPQ